MIDAKKFTLDDLNPGARVYFIGIGGISMSGLAKLAKHAGFVVAESGATASEVYALCAEVTRQVKEKFGVELEMEVRTWGDF